MGQAVIDYGWWHRVLPGPTPAHRIVDRGQFATLLCQLADFDVEVWIEGEPSGKGTKKCGPCLRLSERHKNNLQEKTSGGTS